jgi:hypothetical protein
VTDDKNPIDPAASTTPQRIAWLKEWAGGRPEAAIHLAREAVKEKFGISLGTTNISTIMKEARANAGHPPSRQGRPVFVAGTVELRIKVIVDELRVLGVRRLEITDDNFRADILVTGRKM